MDDWIAKSIRGFGVIFGFASLLCGMAILGWQSYLYLKHGEWFPLGAISTLGWAIDWRWALDPDSWMGLHKLLDMVNAGVACAAIGCTFGAAMSSFEK